MRSLLPWTICICATFISFTEAEGNLMKYLQSNDVGKNYTFENSNTSCTRECGKDEPPRICYYQFTLENYATLTDACMDCSRTGKSCNLPQCVPADGYERGFLSVNRMFPGPSIQVCQGDRIIVDVNNKMLAKSTSIHWHGMFQNGTPYSDGVPMITQCPIHSDNRFRYDFHAHPHGTFYWHSHDGIQKIDGLQGSLIVRRPKENDPHSKLYDMDLPAHHIFITDWLHEDADQHFPGLADTNRGTYASFYLINGLGKYRDPMTGALSNSSYAVFRVTAGNRYRFRVIAATCLQHYVRVHIEGHRLTLIASDGNSVKPVDVDYFELISGERYDFILKAHRHVKSYWIQVEGISSSRWSNSSQLAILQYEGSNDSPATSGNFIFRGTVLNPVNSSCVSHNGVCAAQMEAIEDFNKTVLETPDENYVITFGYHYPTVKEEFHSNTYQSFTYPEPRHAFNLFWMNNIFGINPPSPILSQRGDIPPDVFCPEGQSGLPMCNTSLCKCLHLVRVPLGALVQFMLVDLSDEGGVSHSFHLHGHVFNVMAMGNLQPGFDKAERLLALMNTSKLIRSRAPPLKDTVAVPSEGYAVIRFVADNPGYWLFHCHFSNHHAAGMHLVVQVGGHNDYPRVPRGFPTCGDYLPQFHEQNGCHSNMAGGHYLRLWTFCSLYLLFRYIYN